MHGKNFQADNLLLLPWLFPSKISVSFPQVSTFSKTIEIVAGLDCYNVVCLTLLHFLVFRYLQALVFYSSTALLLAWFNFWYISLVLSFTSE